MKPARDLDRLIEIMAALRDPETGCPWDLEQDFASIRNYTIEEAYEVADAIEREDFTGLCDELGDLLLQPVFHAQMAAERGLFDIGDVVFAITDKLIRRHPHVFGESSVTGTSAVNRRWEEIKAGERAARAEKHPRSEPSSVLDDVAHTLPALLRAHKLAKRVAAIGFDFPDISAVLAKTREELGEVESALTSGKQPAIAEELGDLLFAVASLARYAGVNSETALRDANAKFTRRFAYVEHRCRDDGIAAEEAGLERLEAYWNEIRAAEKNAPEQS